MLQATDPPGDDRDLAVDNVQAILEQRSGRTDIHVGDPAWVALWRANIRLADHYRSGRVLLAGEAAHIHSPAGGQGMNTGIQDANNLGWKLAAVARGADRRCWRPTRPSDGQSRSVCSHCPAHALRRPCSTTKVM